MIESKERIVFNDHVIDIGKGREYGYARVKVANNAFVVSVYDQFDRPIKEDIYPIQRNLTPDEMAFMDSYSSNVADAPPDVVEAFIRAEDHDAFCREYGDEYYTGLADAHGVWYDALTYARGSK
jgi:hypothetical protein